MPDTPTASGPPAHAPSGTSYPYRFGEVGVMMGVLRREQVREALDQQAAQRQAGQAKQIGQIMVERGVITPRQVAAILVAQKRLRTEGGGAPQANLNATDPSQLAIEKKGRGRAASSTARRPAVGARSSSSSTRQAISGSPSKSPSPASGGGGARSSRGASSAARPAVASPAPQAEAAPPKSKRQQLGQFELQRQLGEGSMGAVFEARDTEANRRVALKILPKNLANDAEFLERWRREVKTLSSLNHPNIVAYYGAGQTGGYSYLAMEFVDGESLSSRLKREKRLPEDEALRIARLMSQALGYAHNLTLIHRDIKPENVLLGRDGQVKVIDFGLGKSQEDTSKLTAVGMSIGTPHYLSPEQALGKEHIDHRADLYSVGATLFQMLTGQVPFDHASSTQVMVMHVRQPPPDPRSIVPGITRGASQMVLRLLSKEPEERFANADELIAAIDRVAAGKPVEAGGASRVPGDATGKRQGRTGLLSKVRRGPKGCLSVFLFALALLGAAGAACLW
ncbi:MAG: serine/threonine protein kinase [Planctomycetota bacterium]|nr:serine/threonine protein kinase [Planctomycetota bacterium]